MPAPFADSRAGPESVHWTPMIFLRHPRPQSTPGICYGRLDLPDGPGAAAEIAAALAVTPVVTRVLASPALRCRRLAERLAARDGAVLGYDGRLLELDFGQWEGRPWTGIDRAESDPWAADPWNRAPPGGETGAELHARVAEVLRGTPRGTAIVCHAGVIRMACMLLRAESFETVFARPVPYAQPLQPLPPDAPWPL